MPLQKYATYLLYLHLSKSQEGKNEGCISELNLRHDTQKG
jgi:hypothetical protein